jgi:hypothetical protein
MCAIEEGCGDDVAIGSLFDRTRLVSALHMHLASHAFYELQYVCRRIINVFCHALGTVPALTDLRPDRSSDRNGGQRMRVSIAEWVPECAGQLQ